ncbi:MULTISPECIES: anthranilate synthase component I family protein [unclassified Helicobacter]|uniref:anthranilate synthase component I family protein n=1 Tax=unclassified Helicobacter TaxID=2593540 RepID=UPI00131522BF|nr:MULTISPECIES: chorismate-binding protein [unclassified Helicobacter]
MFSTLFPTIQEIRQANLKGFHRLPVAREIYSDFITPIQALRTLKSRSKHVFLLESIENAKQWGRYSFLGFEPSAQIKSNNWNLSIQSKDTRLFELARLSSDASSVRVCDAPRNEECHDALQEMLGDKIISFKAHPKPVLREILALYKSPKIKGLPPFSGGLVGYFAYDSIRYAEKKLDFPESKSAPESTPKHTSHATNQPSRQAANIDDINLMLFEHLVVFDHFAQKLFLIANIDLDDLESSYAAADKKLESIQTMLKSPIIAKLSKSHSVTPPFALLSEFQARFSEAEYCAMVERAKKYIYEGDIFQVVLSNPITAQASGSLLDVYRTLRTSNPSPYMFYIMDDDLEIAGASPETLVKLDSGALYTYPLAGSRPRGANEKEDKELESNLLQDEKELAEHNMLVDLGRNDIGKVSEIGSVEVISYKHIVRYSHIMHIASTIKSQIAHDKDALDALEAILPAGTLSGAPKIRACEIIHELEVLGEFDKAGANKSAESKNIAESSAGNAKSKKADSGASDSSAHEFGDADSSAEPSPREIYGGAIGYLDFSGNMDTCIAIRLVYKKNDRVFVRAGAGIVYDSDPHAEYVESKNKAKAIICALEKASEGIE